VGTIDKVWIKVECGACGVREIATALDKGSGWSGSAWERLGEFSHFDVEVDGGGAKEPTVVSAKCKGCGETAAVEAAYGMKRPDGF